MISFHSDYILCLFLKVHKNGISWVYCNNLWQRLPVVFGRSQEPFSPAAPEGFLKVTPAHRSLGSTLAQPESAFLFLCCLLPPKTRLTSSGLWSSPYFHLNLPSLLLTGNQGLSHGSSEASKSSPATSWVGTPEQLSVPQGPHDALHPHSLPSPTSLNPLICTLCSALLQACFLLECSSH